MPAMQCVSDFVESLALLGAAVSFALYLALRYARQVAGVADALAKVRRSHLAVFLAFALKATDFVRITTSSLKKNLSFLT